MFSLVEQWKVSNQSKILFCKNNSINIHTFDYWYFKYKKQNASTNFIEIKPPKTITTGKLRLTYPNGVSIELPENTNLALISSLIHIQ